MEYFKAQLARKVAGFYGKGCVRQFVCVFRVSTHIRTKTTLENSVKVERYSVVKAFLCLHFPLPMT